jgi:hypothetical protein
MTIELTISVLYVFRRWSGLYFWSVLVTTWSVSLHAIGFLLSYCVPSCSPIASSVLAGVGWVGMVSGFAVVLYSRLNLVSFVMENRHILKMALAMIIIDATLFNIPTLVIFIIGTSSEFMFEKYLKYMNLLERLQIVAFSVQELILSGLYIYGTFKMARDSYNIRVRKTIRLLIIVQIAAILCGVLLITLDFAGYYILKSFIHSFVYAFKLQMEFVILNEFKQLVTQGRPGSEAIENDFRDSTYPNMVSLPKITPSSCGNDIVDVELHSV